MTSIKEAIIKGLVYSVCTDRAQCVQKKTQVPVSSLWEAFKVEEEL